MRWKLSSLLVAMTLAAATAGSQTLSLEEAVRTALENSPRVSAAEERAKAAATRLAHRARNIKDVKQAMRAEREQAGDSAAAGVCRAVLHHWLRAWVLEPGPAGLRLLAADLLATDRRARALNLGRDRQLAACLLRWYRDNVSRES